MGDLTPAQIQAVAALLGGATQFRAAEAAGVCERTIRNWQAQTEFRDALRAGRRALLEQSMHLLHQAAHRAIRTLCEVMDDQNARPYERASAARSILGSS